MKIAAVLVALVISVCTTTVFASTYDVQAFYTTNPGAPNDISVNFTMDLGVDPGTGALLAGTVSNIDLTTPWLGTLDPTTVDGQMHDIIIDPTGNSSDLIAFMDNGVIGTLDAADLWFVFFSVQCPMDEAPCTIYLGDQPNPEDASTPVSPWIYGSFNSVGGYQAVLEYELTEVLPTWAQVRETAVDGTWAPTAVVPVPTAVWLFCSGLLGLIGVARRKVRD